MNKPFNQDSDPNCQRPCNHEGTHLERQEDHTVWCRTCTGWFIQPVPYTEVSK